MCGIAGFVASPSGNAQDLDQIVRNMTRALERRGPDSEGLHSFHPHAVFGHRRLAILDLSPAGHQPMLTEDGQTGIVFNGCVYNFLELRQELEKRGQRFHSQCDTEVLLRGYVEWGIDELARRLRGMFAVAIWDVRQQRLFLLRDRLGVKPLVYCQQGSQLAFASTIPALRLSGLTGGLNAGGMLEFLEFGWISEDQTIQEHTHKVPPAGIVEWHNGQVVSSRSYWQLPEPGSRPMRFEEAVDRTEELLLEAVRLRLISDVPVAALLSAGTDSTLVCWALTKLQANVRSFTISTPGDPADEAPEAIATARQLGLPHEVIALPPGEQPSLSDLINAYSEPFACSSALGMLRVCRAVKPHATVLLTGDGGDDIFLGYPHYRHFLTAQRVAQWLPAPLAAAWRGLDWHPSSPRPLKRAAHLLDYAAGGLGAVTSIHDGLPYFYGAGLLGPRLQHLKLASRCLPLSHDSGRRLLSDFHSYELRTRFVSEYMTKVDGSAMFHAIETRSPFLDQQLWEFAAGLPHAVRLQGQTLKPILRAIVARHLGEAVAHRRKRGFTIPVERWLVSTWRPQLEALQQGSQLEEDGWLRRGSLRPAITQALAQGAAPVQLWYLVVLENWLRHNSAVPLTAPLEAAPC